MNDGGQLRSLGVSCFCIENYFFSRGPGSLSFLMRVPSANYVGPVSCPSVME